MSAINTPTYMRLRDQVRADIVAGLWPLGSHVTLAQLSNHYQVSANPVREALLQLQGEGVVDMRMNRGAVIPSVDARYIDNLYRLRGAIQVMLARDAAVSATATNIEAMYELSAQYEAAVSSSDVPRCVTANRALHRYIDGISDNPLALEILDNRSSLADAFRRSKGYQAGRLEVVVAQHRTLVAAIASGDPERAAQVTLEHTDSSRVDLLSLLLS
jgi:DNA-binding GntR family transcriptional regulator